jgi:hypothetical protein
MAIAAPPRPNIQVEIDWEASAGVCEPAVPRVAPLTYVYHGFGDPHWQGQRCSLLAAEDGLDHVVFACGCRGDVPLWTLTPVAA